MLRSKEVKFLKALTMSALLAKSGMSAVQENRDETAVGYQFAMKYRAEMDRNDHTARFVATLIHISGQGEQIRNGLTPIPTSVLLSQYKRELDKLKKPQTLDLNADNFDKVVRYLEAARANSIKVKLTLDNIKASQLDTILWDYPDAIEELNWNYEATPTSYEDDWNEGVTKKITEGNTPDWGDDDWDDDDWEETTPGNKKTKKITNDDDWSDEDWDDDGEADIEGPRFGHAPRIGFDRGGLREDDGEYYDFRDVYFYDFDAWDIDDFGMMHPHPRRAAARGRDPLRLDQLVENLGQEGRLQPFRNRMAPLRNNRVIPVRYRVILPVNGANEHGRILEGQPNAIVPAVYNNDNQEDKGGSNRVSWKITIAKNESKDSLIPTNMLTAHGSQAHALVKTFCRGNRGA